MSIAAVLRASALAVFTLCSAVQAGTIYVSPAGNDANNGSNWATAKKTVQAGLNAAQSGGQVWVAAGTYVERITLKAGVALYGGFTGSETELARRNWAINVTVLDGNQGGSVVTAPSGATAATRIDGFTIRNGNAFNYGGGVYCSSASPTIVNNTITSNGGAIYGGGLYLAGSSATIANNIITSNSASSDGGGLYLAGSSATITNNIITSNSAHSTGGGLCLTGSSATITNNIIISNSISGYGGGLYLANSFPTIANNTITANVAQYGGGLYLSGSSPMIANNTVTGNSASRNGGGLLLKGSSPTITNNTISNNSASSYGGGLYLSGSSPTITNNTIANNSADEGGGLYLDSSSPTVTNNTVTNNSASSNGGGLYLSYSSPTIVNTIVAFNSSGFYRDETSGTATFRCNCVYDNAVYDYSGLPDPTDTSGNIKADPKLAGYAYGNLHLQPGSPCIDSGSDSDVQAGWLDVDGQPRMQGMHVDIGADEANGTIWPSGPCTIVRVSPLGNDANNGSSWALAKKTVQAGINAAAALGGEVWVAGGTYYERITLQPYAYLYGGFVGTETQKDQRNWATNVTILDGQQGGSVVSALAGYRVSTIDGFTIRNGKASYGGGLYLANASPTIANNTVTGNSALNNGGGLYLSGSSPMIANNTVAGNSALYHGGGLYLTGSFPTIANNTVTGNSASKDGGGLYLASSSPTITNNTVTGNSASGYGGGLCLTDSSPTITNSTVTSNSGLIYGGGFYLSYSSPTVVNCTIAGNSSNLAGGLYLYNSSPIIANSVIALNSVVGIYQNVVTATLRYNCVYGNAKFDYIGLDPTGTYGNISIDPGFVRATAPLDVHLAPGSPCINAGDPTYTASSGETDVDGQPRIMGGRVDMGACECKIPPGDINTDGTVNAADFELIGVGRTG